MSILVKAIKPGFANGARKRVGDEFTLADGVKPGHWMEVVKTNEPKRTKDELDVNAGVAAAAEVKKLAAAKKNASLRNLTPTADGLV